MAQQSLEETVLKRGLEARHIELIALGGTIGVGLFMGSASTVQWAGPSVLLAYIIAGLFIFFIMRAMGEMLYLEPVTGSFAIYAHRYIGPLAGYLTAWSYWFMWVAVGMSEVTAVGIYVKFWLPDFPQWLPGLAALLIVGTANMVAVRYYGEFEFWFAFIKVVTIVVMIIVGFGLIFFGLGNGGVPVGLGNLVNYGGFFPGGVTGFLFAMCLVVAAYQGVELVGITAGEAKNPQHTLRRAIQNIIWRILIFYVGAIFVIVAVYPWNQLGLLGSPFVLTFAKVGIVAAASIINFVVITAALSGCNSGIYSSGRMLFTLAQNGQLPRFFAKVSAGGVPVNSLIITLLCLLVGVGLNFVAPPKLFVYIYSASVLPGMVPWFVLLITQIRFRQQHQREMAQHPFTMPFSPWSNYLTVIFLLLVLVGMWFNDDTKLSLLVGMGFIALVIISYYVLGISRRVALLPTGGTQED